MARNTQSSPTSTRTLRVRSVPVAPVTPDNIKMTPKTEKVNNPKRVNKPTTNSLTRTPNKPIVKKRSAASDAASRPAKRRNNGTSSNNPDDPFSFDDRADEVPDFLGNIKVERKSFGREKFFNNPNGNGDESTANGNNSNLRQSLVAELLNKSELRDELARNKTPKSSPARRKNATPRASKKIEIKTEPASKDPKKIEYIEEDDDENEFEAPSPVKKKPADSTLKKPKVEKEKEKAPVLTAEEQVKADDWKQNHYAPGARVFAIWGKEYYSAVVGDRDGLGRCKVFYTEDQSMKPVPPMGLVPLNLIREGCQISVVGEPDEEGERIVYDGKVLSVPDMADSVEWTKGIYSIEMTCEENPEPQTRDIEWFDIYLTEPQYKQITKSMKKPADLVPENIIEGEGGRRSKRAVKKPELFGSTVDIVPAKPKSRPKAKKRHPEPDVDDESEPNESQEAFEASPIFEGLYFSLTSANRVTGPPAFLKKSVKKAIERRAGNVVENLEDIDEGETIYLLADTYYITKKYLTALSLSIPTVSYKWIEESVKNNRLMDYRDYMLAAGESIVDLKAYPWKPSKGTLFFGKRIALYSPRQVTDPRVLNFRDIWSPLVKNVGGVVITDIPIDSEDAKQWFIDNEALDFCIFDDDTPEEIIDASKEAGADPVSSEWLIQSIVTGEVVDANISPRFRPKIA